MGDLDPRDIDRTIMDKFSHLMAERKGSQIRMAELKNEASKLTDVVVGGVIDI